MNSKSYFVIIKLINFLQKHGKKTKIYLIILNILKFLSIKYSKTIYKLIYHLFIKWRPLIELRHIKTKTKKYIIGVPIKSHRLYYILFKLYFLMVRKIKNSIFHDKILIICIEILEKKNKILNLNNQIFKEAHKNRAYLHFRRFINF